MKKSIIFIALLMSSSAFAKCTCDNFINGNCSDSTNYHATAQATGYTSNGTNTFMKLNCNFTLSSTQSKFSTIECQNADTKNTVYDGYASDDNSFSVNADTDNAPILGSVQYVISCKNPNGSTLNMRTVGSDQGDLMLTSPLYSTS